MHVEFDDVRCPSAEGQGDAMERSPIKRYRKPYLYIACLLRYLAVLPTF